ncbi:MAG: Gfo/Idh/MocA family oxidoreductase [Verrucomicrobiota bacterium]
MRCGFFLSLLLVWTGVWGGEVRFSKGTGPLRLAVAGLSHGHVESVMGASRRDDVTLVGVWEPDEELAARFALREEMKGVSVFSDLEKMIEESEPEAVSGMTSIGEHLRVVEACAPRGVHVFLEKPLDFSAERAKRMVELGEEYGVLVLTNFETSWYASVREVGRTVKEGGIGEVRRMVFRHGHKGPEEIGCRPEFLKWLMSEEGKGGGASVDFGCSGAVIATWLMDGQRPEEVTALVHHVKSGDGVVDDDATILLRYKTAQAVIQASWAWTHDCKEMDVFGTRGSLHAGKWDQLESRAPDGQRNPERVRKMAGALSDQWVYLREVVRGECPVDALSSPEANLVVAEILEAALGE